MILHIHFYAQEAEQKQFPLFTCLILTYKFIQNFAEQNALHILLLDITLVNQLLLILLQVTIVILHYICTCN